jgi:hypothetical protein
MKAQNGVEVDLNPLLTSSVHGCECDATSQHSYRGADKSLARPTSRCI